MSHYVVICIDNPDSLELRLANREAHLAYVQSTDLVNFIVGGPFLSEDQKMIGSMLIVETDDRAKLDEFLAGDPYGKAGLFQSVGVHAWKATVGSLG